MRAVVLGSRMRMITAAKRYTRSARLQRDLARQVDDYLWIVLGITSMQGDRLQIESAIKIDRGDDVSSGRLH
jgi:hypothetical protein